MRRGKNRQFFPNRYRVMIKACLEAGKPFGIVNPRFRNYGCLAAIKNVIALDPDG